MGYELDRLMKQFGVSTAATPTYAGQAKPTENITQPVVNPTYNGFKYPNINIPVTTKPTVNQNYDTQMAQYNADMAEYNDYLDRYKNRIASGSMYNSPQYNAGLPGTYTGVHQDVTPLTAPVYAPVTPIVTTPTAPVTSTTPVDTAQYQDFGPLPNSYVNFNYAYSHGGPVKTHFFEGGLNEMSNTYGVTTPLDTLQTYNTAEHSPRPAKGPLGKWLEEVAMEAVPGIHVAGRKRTPERNRQVGGVADSLHMSDNAIDLDAPKGMSNSQLGDTLKQTFGSDFDVIYNRKGHYDHVHVEPGPALARSALGQSPARRVVQTSAPAGGANIDAGSTNAEIDGAAAATPNRQQALIDMIDKMGIGQSSYGADLKAAQTRANDETQAFANMITGAMNTPEDEKMSKAELYFRLASAFGSPTKTGGLGENIAMAGQEMGEYTKGQREAKRQNLNLRLQAQQLKSAAAKEELGNLRTLAAQEMSDKRALIKDFIDSGKPMSEAGKQALDEGLEPGTPKYQARVGAIFQEKVDAQAQVLGIQTANLRLSQNREERQSRQAGKLSPTEITMRRDTEDSIENINSAMETLRQAYRLNPNTFDTSVGDLAQRKTLEVGGSKDPKLLNTRLVENMLAEQALSMLKTAFGGNPTEGERAIMLDLQGIGAKSIEERSAIMRRGFQALQRRSKAATRRLEDIKSGAYHESAPEE